MLKRFVLPLFAVIAFSPVRGFAQTVTQPITPTPPPVTKILPNNLLGVILVNTTQDNWGKLNQFNPYPFQISGPSYLPLLPAGMKYEEDVKPWVGNWVAIGAFVPQKMGDGMYETFSDNIIMVMPVKDATGSKNFVSKVRSVQIQTPVERVYKGVQIIEWLEREVPLNDEPNTPIPPAEAIPEQPQTNQNKALIAAENPKPNPDTNNQKPPATPEPEIKPSPPENEENFPDVELTVTEPGYAIALFNGYVVSADKAGVLEKLIDSQTNTTSIANTPNFQKTLNHPKFEQAVMVGYTNFTEAAKMVSLSPRTKLPSWLQLPPALTPENPPTEPTTKQEKNPENKPTETPVPTEIMPEETPVEEMPVQPISSFEELVNQIVLEFAREYDSLDVIGWVDEQGIRSQANQYFNKLKPDYATKPKPEDNQILSRFPAATYLSINTRNLKQQWERINQQSGDKGKETLDAMRKRVLETTGLDVDKDIFGWMDKEVGFLFFPSDGGLFPTLYDPLKIGMSLMIQTSNRGTAEKTITRLEELLKINSNNFFTKNTRDVGKETVVSWEAVHPRKGNQSVLSYRWSDDNTLIVTTGTNPMARLTPSPNPALNNTYLFQSATQSFDKPNDGYYFINWGATLALFYNIFPEVFSSPYEKEIKQAMGTIRSFSGSWLTTPEKDQSDFMIMLAPKK